jgi:hypothetical protein
MGENGQKRPFFVNEKRPFGAKKMPDQVKNLPILLKKHGDEMKKTSRYFFKTPRDVLE